MKQLGAKSINQLLLKLAHLQPRSTWLSLENYELQVKEVGSEALA